MQTTLLIILLWAAASFSLFLFTFIFYLAVITLHTAEQSGQLKNTHVLVHKTAYFILFVGLILDTLLNWVFLSVTFMEFPRELLSTARVKRHKLAARGWRYKQANWWCKNWLTPFDFRHCDLE